MTHDLDCRLQVASDEAPAPIDYMLRGHLKADASGRQEPIGLELIPGYLFRVYPLRSMLCNFSRSSHHRTCLT